MFSNQLLLNKTWSLSHYRMVIISQSNNDYIYKKPVCILDHMSFRFQSTFYRRSHNAVGVHTAAGCRSRVDRSSSGRYHLDGRISLRLYRSITIVDRRATHDQSFRCIRGRWYSCARWCAKCVRNENISESLFVSDGTVRRDTWCCYKLYIRSRAQSIGESQRFRYVHETTARLLL